MMPKSVRPAPLTYEERSRLLQGLRALTPGQRVIYRCWRGDSGQGVMLRFVSGATGKPVEPTQWGHDRMDGVLVKRDFSADDGRVFRPFLGDGDDVQALDGRWR